MKNRLKTFIVKFSYIKSNGKLVDGLYCAIKASDKDNVKERIIKEGLESSTCLTELSSTNVNFDLRTIKEYDYKSDINIITFL